MSAYEYVCLCCIWTCLFNSSLCCLLMYSSMYSILCCPWTLVFYSRPSSPWTCLFSAVCAAPGRVCSKAVCAPHDVSVLHQQVLPLEVSVLHQPWPPLEVSVLLYSSLCCPWMCLFYVLPGHACSTAVCAAQGRLFYNSLWYPWRVCSASASVVPGRGWSAEVCTVTELRMLN